MRVAAFLVAACLIPDAGLQAQQPVSRLRALAVAGERAALTEAIRTHPDDARELVRQLLVDAARSRRAPDSLLAIARTVGSAYSAAWEDSFPEAQVERFAMMDPARRRAKVAADSVRRAGNTALGTAGVGAALRIWRAALRRSQAIGDSTGTAAALGNIGIAHYRAALLDSAEIVLARARDLATAIGDHRTAANALGALGSVAKERGDLRGARELHERARALRARIGDIRGTASDHTNLGLIAASLGDGAGARVQYRQALTLARRHGLHDAAAAALLNLANLASSEGEYAEAIRGYDEALALYRSLGSEGDVALTLHDIGLLALRRGDYAKAEDTLKKALAIFLRVGTVPEIVAVRRDLATVAAACGDLRGAMAQLRLAENALARVADTPVLAADVALARADLAMQLNALADAERQYQRAEALYRRVGDDAARAEAQQGIAILLLERGDYARAIALLRSVARGQDAGTDRRSRALTELMIGYAHFRRGDPGAARQALEGARDSLHALGDAASEGAALGTLADLELDAGRPRAAEAFLRRGLALTGARGSGAMSWQLRAGLGRALRARGALGDASRELRAAVEELERAAATLTSDDWRTMFLADKWDVYAQLAIIEHARSDIAAAFATSERLRARQMLDIVARGRVSHPTPTDAALLEREQDLRRQIAELTQRLEGQVVMASSRRGPALLTEPGGGESARELLARAQEEYARLLRDLQDREPTHPSGLRAPVASWRDVAGRLRDDEALVEYLVADSTTLAFVVRRDTIHAVDLGVGRASLESLIDFARGALVVPTGAATRRTATPAWRGSLQRLHERLISPLERSGTLAGATRLVIVPHAELHYLPFAALIGRANGAAGERETFLVERYELTYAPSASVWTRLGMRATRPGSRTAQPRVLALAPRPRALPGSRDEVQRIRSLYGARATVLIDRAASEQAFRSAAPSYDIVHLATVGVLNKHNPLFSYVSLGPAPGTDGRIEVHEVFGLEMNARLLVLSACQTALGSGATADVPAGDDWVGLVRAFLGIGVQKVVATLWPVEDRSTARLMAQLHEGLQSGRSEAEALAAAQRAALRARETADPFYWAGFVLVGSR